MKKAFAWILLIMILWAGTAGSEKPGLLGQPSPDFTVTDTEGHSYTLSETLKDHEAVLINFWATWCPPCVGEFPCLNEAYEKYGDRVAFLALSCEETDTPEKIAAFRTEYGLSLPMGRDEGAALFLYTGAMAIPVTIVVDRFGNAAFYRLGRFSDEGEVERVLETFLGDGYTETVVLENIP